MVFLNYTTMQMTPKIVYYGPGLCGKTTNLQHIHHKTSSRSRGEMVSLETESDRTLFFDLLPLDVGVVGGMKVRLQLYTVPGQVFYNATRKLVLKNLDGIVFVADSQEQMLDPNLESLGNLHENLAELGLGIGDVPVVFQFNKRDIRNILSVEEMNRALNPGGFPVFEAAALHGIGVFETLKGISALTLMKIRQSAQGDADPRKIAPRRSAAPAVPSAPAAAPTPPPAPPAPSIAQLVASAHAVEFAEADSGDHRPRAVATKGQLDIQLELEKLRELTVDTGTRKPARTQDFSRQLEQILVSERVDRAELNRKATIQVPSRVLAGSKTLRVHLVFDSGSGEDVVKDVVTVVLPDSRSREGLRLHLDLDLKSKG